MEVQVINNNPEKANLIKEKIGFTLDYGTMKQKQDSEVHIAIVGQDIKDYSVSSSCGCTVPSISKTGDTCNLYISYDTKRIGDFTGKTVRFDFKHNNIKKRITISLKGTVKRR